MLVTSAIDMARVLYARSFIMKVHELVQERIMSIKW